MHSKPKLLAKGYQAIPFTLVPAKPSSCLCHKKAALKIANRIAEGGLTKKAHRKAVRQLLESLKAMLQRSE